MIPKYFFFSEGFYRNKSKCYQNKQYLAKWIVCQKVIKHLSQRYFIKCNIYRFLSSLFFGANFMWGQSVNVFLYFFFSKSFTSPHIHNCPIPLYHSFPWSNLSSGRKQIDVFLQINYQLIAPRDVSMLSRIFNYRIKNPCSNKLRHQILELGSLLRDLEDA